MTYNAKYFPEWNKVMVQAFSLFEKHGDNWTAQMYAHKLNVGLRTVFRWKAKLKQLKTERFQRKGNK